ncbi:MAG: alpha/beta fold hydrolase, partial [Microgenomates group bacterium]
LRERSYQSSLQALEKISQSSNYETFLTSYDSDGLKINALLTRPTGEIPENGWPAIVFVHGYIPPSLYETTERYEAYVDFLARNGFVVLKTDLRGHGESEGEAGGAYYSSDYVIDTLNARAALQESAYINPDKIGLWGHSMAGNVVLRSMATRPEIPAIVIWGGAVFSYEDFQKYRLNDSSYRPPSDTSARQQRRNELFETKGELDPANDFWRMVAPTNYLSDIEGAIQLHHAVDDETVNVLYSRDLADMLDQTTIPHEYQEYQTGGHNITGSSFTSAMNRTVDFFKTHL